MSVSPCRLSLALPKLPIDDFVNACVRLAEVDARWVPDPGEDGEKSLYLRPFMIANQDFLGVAPATTVLFSVIGSPAVSYTHLTLPTTLSTCRSRWSPYH